MPIPFTKIVTGLPASIPFVGPETLERQRGRRFKARIGANESCFGVSPLAAEAMRDAVANVNWYGDPENFELREALADKHGVELDEICVDAGIDTLLGVIVRMLVAQDQPVVTSLGAYPTFNYHVNGFGAQLVTVPYRDDHEDPTALIEATIANSAPLLYFCNPDNPMGTWHDAATVQAFIAAIPASTVAVLDEAYVEFAEEDISPPIDTTNERIIRLRTFSKAYGMAGARIGYAIAHRDLVSSMNKIRNHFGVNRIAQIGARAALQDSDFLPRIRDAAARGRARIYQVASRHRLTAIPSATNFVTVDVGSAERAQNILSALNDHDVFMRMPGVEPLNRCIRIGLGTDQEHAAFEAAFDTIINDTA